MDTLKVGIIGSRLLGLFFGVEAALSVTYIPERVFYLLAATTPGARFRYLVIIVIFVVRLVVEAVVATHLMMNSESVARWAARFVDLNESIASKSGVPPIPHPEGLGE